MCWIFGVEYAKAMISLEETEGTCIFVRKQLRSEPLPTGLFSPKVLIASEIHSVRSRSSPTTAFYTFETLATTNVSREYSVF